MTNKLNETRITVNKLTVSYIDEGSVNAPVIIFIHGFPLNKFMWIKQIETLTDEYRVIAYDIRGHGNSDAGDDNFAIDLFVNDLIVLMDALKIKKTMLCGLSMGGYIALKAIVSHPERFSSMILSDTTCMADTPEGKEKRVNAIENITKNGVEKYAQESLEKLFATESFTTKREEIAFVRQMIVETSKQSLYNTLHALADRKETCGQLQDIKVPVLIMVGKEDVITPLEAAKFMHEKIRDSILYIIGHAGHLSNMENPGEYNDKLRKFISPVKS